MAAAGRSAAKGRQFYLISSNHPDRNFCRFVSPSRIFPVLGSSSLRVNSSLDCQDTQNHWETFEKLSVHVAACSAGEKLSECAGGHFRVTFCLFFNDNDMIMSFICVWMYTHFDVKGCAFRPRFVGGKRQFRSGLLQGVMLERGRS